MVSLSALVSKTLLSLRHRYDSTLTSHAIVDLPGHFCVWLHSAEAGFLRGKFVWVNWDVDELKAKKEQIMKTDLLNTKLGGVSFVDWEGVDV